MSLFNDSSLHDSSLHDSSLHDSASHAAASDPSSAAPATVTPDDAAWTAAPPMTVPPPAAPRWHKVVLSATALLTMATGLWLTRPQEMMQAPSNVQRTQRCLTNLGRIATAFAQYASDYDGKFPRGVDPEDRYNARTWTPVWQGGSDSRYGGIYRRDARTVPMLHDLLHPYLRDREAWHCPDDTGYVFSSLPGFESGLHNVKPSSWAKYGTSYYYLTLRGFAGMTAADFKHPGRSISLFDGDLWHHPDGRPSVNALFVDGHVQNLRPAQFSELMGFDEDRP